MIRRIFDFVLVLLFVWVCMILGLWVIHSFIVPLELPGMLNGIVSAVLKVVISAAMVLLWLWTWREMIKRIFWRAIKMQQRFINKSRNNTLRKKR